ncbi:hypothetical protein MKW92_005928 [Papaver armeniacum]|nr:hypothetical protein MKW92_005928 [Papaver armeniacum]
MADSSDSSVSVDIETIISLGGKEHIVHTGHGSVSVVVFGDPDKPALVTYPDLALDHMSCFQGLFFCPEADSLLLHNFCIYHISPPGHELGAAQISPDSPVPTIDDLADQVADVLDYFGLGAVMCLGVTVMKYRERVLGLILVSPLCLGTSWKEWLYNKVTFSSTFVSMLFYRETSRCLIIYIQFLQFMLNLLYFYGMCGIMKECLLQRYFSKEVRGGPQVPESDIVQACRSLLDERKSGNVSRFLQAINDRYDLTSGLKKLRCRTLIFVGDESPYHSEALHMAVNLDRRYSALVEVQACGSMVTEEQPHAMLIPLEYFFMGYGLYRPVHPSCISPELLSPESMGLKLKPIKTRLSMKV